MQTIFKIGTRGSKLALVQANWVKDELQQHYPAYKFEICIIKTQGDIKKDVPLEIIGGKGVFVKDIQKALLDETIDLAVHSMKDVPARLPEGSTMGAVPIRENPQDVLISVSGLTLENLPKGARVGTSSLRRTLLVKEIRPDLDLLPIRGNVETRIQKMRHGQYDAIILAAAGIHRIGGDLVGQITQYLPVEGFIPAVGQAALGIEVLVGSHAQSMVKVIHDEKSGYAVGAERAFLRKLNGNCKIPIAAHARIQGEQIIITGVIAKDKDSKLYYGTKQGPAREYEELGGNLAEEIIKKAGITLEDWLKIQEGNE